jgi:hypothetical protein
LLRRVILVSGVVSAFSVAGRYGAIIMLTLCDAVGA